MTISLYIVAAGAAATLLTGPVALAGPRPLVLAGKGYMREHRLPVCEWAPDRDNMLQIMFDQDAEVYWWCKNGSATCGWAGHRPSDASYRIAGSYYSDPSFYGGRMAWPDGTTVHGSWGATCTKAASGDRDVVASHMVEGRVTGSIPGGATEVPSLLAEVDGAVVEHLRPARVLATVQLARDPVYQRRVENDIVVAIQVASPDGWADVATRSYTSEGILQDFRAEAVIEPGEAVRLQVRGTWRVTGNQMGTGYELRDARLLVETCIPDSSSPEPACL